MGNNTNNNIDMIIQIIKQSLDNNEGIWFRLSFDKNICKLSTITGSYEPRFIFEENKQAIENVYNLIVNQFINDYSIELSNSTSDIMYDGTHLYLSIEEKVYIDFHAYNKEDYNWAMQLLEKYSFHSYKMKLNEINVTDNKSDKQK